MGLDQSTSRPVVDFVDMDKQDAMMHDYRPAGRLCDPETCFTFLHASDTRHAPCMDVLVAAPENGNMGLFFLERSETELWRKSRWRRGAPDRGVSRRTEKSRKKKEKQDENAQRRTPVIKGL